MRRRLIIILIALGMALHGAVPMSLAGTNSAPAPDGSLLAALQVICTGVGVIDPKDAQDPDDNLPHGCKACPVPSLVAAMVPGMMILPYPRDQVPFRTLAAPGCAGLNAGSLVDRTRAPPTLM